MWYDTLNQVRNTEIVPYLLQFITNQVCRLKETSLRLKTNGFFKGGDRKDSTNVLSVLLLIPRISQEVSLRDLKGQLTKQKLVSGSDLFLLRLDQLRYRISWRLTQLGKKICLRNHEWMQENEALTGRVPRLSVYTQCGEVRWPGNSGPAALFYFFFFNWVYYKI